jgi:hypothetical protein
VKEVDKAGPLLPEECAKRKVHQHHFIDLKVFNYMREFRMLLPTIYVNIYGYGYIYEYIYVSTFILAWIYKAYMYANHIHTQFPLSSSPLTLTPTFLTMYFLIPYPFILSPLNLLITTLYIAWEECLSS